VMNVKRIHCENVVLLEWAGVGGNARQRCKYCRDEFGVNYSRVKSPCCYLLLSIETTIMIACFKLCF
jgi:hypothetical protein